MASQKYVENAVGDPEVVVADEAIVPIPVQQERGAGHELQFFLDLMDEEADMQSDPPDLK